jgi:hypothetical protein
LIDSLSSCVESVTRSSATLNTFDSASSTAFVTSSGSEYAISAMSPATWIKRRRSAVSWTMRA